MGAEDSIDKETFFKFLGAGQLPGASRGQHVLSAQHVSAHPYQGASQQKQGTECLQSPLSAAACR